MSKRRTAKKNTQPKPLRKKLTPKTEYQRDYILQMAESDITICTGPAGTGKTAVAVALACEYILDKKIEKIIITRPVVEVGTRGLGYLPGSLNEKMQPWVVPLLEEMKLLGTAAVHELIDEEMDAIGSLSWQLKQDNDIKMKDGTSKSAKIIETDIAPSCRAFFNEIESSLSEAKGSEPFAILQKECKHSSSSLMNCC